MSGGSEETFPGQGAVLQREWADRGEQKQVALIAAPLRLLLMEYQSLVEKSGEAVEGAGSGCRFWASSLGMPVWLHPICRQRHFPGERTGRATGDVP